jgi:hypothetical protein
LLRVAAFDSVLCETCMRRMRVLCAMLSLSEMGM